MEIVPETLEFLTHVKDDKFQSFASNFPNHGMLSGTDYAFTPKESEFASIFRDYFGRQSRLFNAEPRRTTLKHMAPLAYRF